MENKKLVDYLNIESVSNSLEYSKFDPDKFLIKEEKPRRWMSYIPIVPKRIIYQPATFD